jgi:hypothetical protein
MTSVFWTSRPSILLQNDKLGELWPSPKMTADEKQNAMTRLVLLLTLIGYAVSKSINVLVTGAVAIGIIIFLNRVTRIQGKEKSKESFSNAAKGTLAKRNEKTATNPYVGLENGEEVQFVMPTKNNPMMNVLLPEINENPYRNPAAPSFDPVVEEDINKEVQNNTVDSLADGIPEKSNEIDERLFRDLGDAYQFDQSMQRFYTTANTQIPNDQKAFAEFCYGDMPSCKAGDSIQCIKNNARQVPPI